MPNHRSDVLARIGGTTLPGWIGFVVLALVQLCRRSGQQVCRVLKIEIASI